MTHYIAAILMNYMTYVNCNISLLKLNKCLE